MNLCRRVERSSMKTTTAARARARVRGEGAARVGDAGRGTGTGRDDAGRDARDEHRRGNGNERMGVVLQGREDVDACGHTVVRGLDGASATARASARAARRAASGASMKS